MSRICETYLDLLQRSNEQRLAMSGKKKLITADAANGYAVKSDWLSFPMTDQVRETIKC